MAALSKSTNNALQSGRGLSFHLYEEADRFLRSWAVVESERLSREPWRVGSRPLQMRSLQLSEAHRDLATASLRDALMCLGRMTDVPQGDKLTIFKLPGLMTDNVIDHLRNVCGGPGFDRAALFLRGPVCKWDAEIKAKTWRDSEQKNLCERPYTLMNFRTEYSRFRNALHAHAADKTNLGGLWLDRYRIMGLICVSATVASIRVFDSQVWDAKRDFYRYRRNQAALAQGLSTELLHYKAGALERRIWETQNRG